MGLAVDAAIYPPVARPPEPRGRAACPVFKRDSVLTRPDAGIASGQTVSPGLHRFEPGSGEPYEVVWWDPHALNLGVEPPFGLRRQDLIARDVASRSHCGGSARLHDMAAGPRGCADEAGRFRPAGSGRRLNGPPLSQFPPAGCGRSRPAAVETVIARWSDDPSNRGSLREPGARGSRRHPARCGIAGHRRHRGTQARILGATPESPASAADAVAAVLQHPLFAEARAADRAGTCLRETPVTVTLEGELIEGTVDLAYDVNGRTTVIDFKTDRVDE